MRLSSKGSIIPSSFAKRAISLSSRIPGVTLFAIPPSSRGSLFPPSSLVKHGLLLGLLVPSKGAYNGGRMAPLRFLLNP
ncbi:hypothetical protein phiLo_09 [Thermus phage phiLo]|nr:hypothetical protein phiLo_09 [Thermus phage phiLo]